MKRVGVWQCWIGRTSRMLLMTDPAAAMGEGEGRKTWKRWTRLFVLKIAVRFVASMSSLLRFDSSPTVSSREGRKALSVEAKGRV